MNEREVEKAKSSDLVMKMARLQAKHNKIIHEKEEALKARDDMVDKLGKENAMLEHQAANLKKQIEELKTPNVAIRKPGPRREVEGGGVWRVSADISKEGGESSIDPTVAAGRPGPRREVEGEGSTNECDNTIPETTPEDPEMVEGPVEVQTTISMDERKEI